MWRNTVLATVQIEESSPIEVRDSDGYKAVFATAAIAEDSVIFVLNGELSTEPTRYTIQLGQRRHLNFPAFRKDDDDLDYCWQYLNHCCEPNGYMDTTGRTFRALRNIEPGEEITFNYLTTESSMAVPFQCICGSADCYGFIAGRDFLTRAQSARLASTMGDDNVVTLFMPANERRQRSSGALS